MRGGVGAARPQAIYGGSFVAYPLSKWSPAWKSWVSRTYWSHFDFWVGSHNLGHEIDYEIGLHDIFRKLSVVDITFGVRDRS